jgi:hypothetical protein
MGRTSKFTFPVPGRRQKPTVPPPTTTISASMSKAQRILGTTDINVDTTRHWDTMSNSGISVTISESTVSHAPTETGLGILTEEPEGACSRGPDWGEESDIVPPNLKAMGTGRRAKFDGPGKENRDAASDASSSRWRRGSTSTIMSWYDKSKLPLSISQQTSASAMAKGLPIKPSSVPDGDGTENRPKPKKKPSRLDLSYLIPRSRSHTSRNQNSSLLGQDYVTKSPSVTSLSPNPVVTPPPIRQRNERTLGRKATKERLNEFASSNGGSRPTTSSSNRRGAGDLGGLHNLYEHYEQMSFRQVMEQDWDAEETAKQPKVDTLALTKRPETRQERSTLVVQPIIRVGRDEEEQGRPQFPRNLPAETNSIPLHGQGLISPPLEYATSISSRHTGTSKASKRTNQSLQRSDLQQSSVLSLSSDSEDDLYIEPPPKTSLSAPLRHSLGEDELPSPSSLRRPATSRAGDRSPVKSAKRATFAPTPTYLTIPDGPPVVKAPSPNPRSSSLSSHAPQTSASSVRSSSRLSVLSTSTANSATAWQNRPGFGIHEARAVPILPQTAYEPLEMHAPQPRSPPRRPTRILSTRSTSASLNSADQPTPPLSPTSVDFYIRSAGSSIDAGGHHNPRFMAVTKQEEMLLAALRLKRARMRESILAEFEEEARGESPYPSYTYGHRDSEATYAEQAYGFLPGQHKLSHRASATSNNTIKGHRTYGRRNSFGDHLAADDHTPMSLHPPASTSNSDPTHLAQHMRGQTRTPREHSPADSQQDHILLYLDRPSSTADMEDTSEPSPDLSDFMDFDDGTSEEEAEGDELLFQSHDPAANDLVSERTTSKHSDEQPQSDSNLLGPMSSPEQIHVVEGEGDEVVGVPRPDSPVSPDGPLGLPVQGKKKAARLSAVGRVGMEVEMWGDNG